MKSLDARTAVDHNIRVYIQSTPTSLDREKLQKVQQELHKELGQGSLVSQDRLHVTLLHLGKPHDVLNQIRKHNPKIDTTIFTRALHTFIADTHHVLPRRYVLKVNGFDFFGGKKDVLVLRLKPNEYYLHTHKTAIRSLHSFLYECGIGNTKKYIHSHNDLKHAYEATPHVTLMRSVENCITPALHSVPDTIEFEPAGIFDTSQ